MKNWLIALLGVSLVAISYTAYELELKKPAMPPLVETVAVSGPSVTTTPAQKPKTPGAKPVSPAPLSQAEPVETKSPAVSVEQKAPAEVAKALPRETGNGAGDDGAEVAGAAAGLSARPETIEQPSIAKKAMDTVVSLLSGATDADDEAVSTQGKTEPMGETAPATETVAQEPPSQPSAMLAPVARAVDTVRKMLSGGDEAETPAPETKATETKAPEPKAQQPVVQDQARSPEVKSEDIAPKGLIERAVKAVTELVTPKTAIDTEKAKQTTKTGGEGSKSAPPAASNEETRLAARSPEPSPPSAEAVKPADGPISPSFDVVRVERDGSAIVAGRAEPGAQIKLRAGGKTLGTAKASGRGEFVIIPDAPIPAGSSALALEAISAGGQVTKSNQVVTVAVPEPKTPSSTQVAAAPAPEPETKAADIEIAAVPAPAAPAVPVPEPKQNVAEATAPVQVPETAVPAVKPQARPEALARPNNSPTVNAAAPVARTATVEEKTPAVKVVESPARTETKVASVPETANPTPPAKVVPAPVVKAPAQTVKAPAPVVEAPAKRVEVPAQTVEAPAPTVKLAETKIDKPSKSDGVDSSQSAIIVPADQTSPPAPAAKRVAAIAKSQIKKPATVAAPVEPAAPEVNPKAAATPVAAEKSVPETAKATTPKIAEPTASKPVVAPAPRVAKAPATKVAEAPAPGVAAATAPKIAEAPGPTPDTAEQKIASVSKPTSNTDAPAQRDLTPPTAAATQNVADTGAGKPAPMAVPEAPPVLSVPKPETDVTVAAAMPDTATVSPAPAAKAPEIKTTDTTKAPAPAPQKLTEPLVVVSEPGKPSQVLQGGKDKPKTPITFETVDYDDEGQIILAGRVAPGADVRAYLGAAHLGDARADPQGQWVLRTTRRIDPGTYQLRVDKIDIGGKVLARVTAPFERAAPEAVARVRANGEVIIQPGDNLWNISRALYGSGTQYTIIYDANRNQISKPDLIFPGQVFMTPGAPSPKAAAATSG